MISNFLIGLREGLEAALVVSILVAYLVRTSRNEKLVYVWAGVAGAIGLSLIFGAALSYTQFGLLSTEREQEIFAGAMSFTAVVFVTWMIIWMRDTGSKIAQELQGKLEAAITGGAVTIAVMAFVAVAREGLETALFFFTAVQASGSTIEPVIGFVGGIGSAVLIGYLLYRRAIKVDLKKFFTVTGYFLIFVAAGVLLYGIHEWQEAGLLPGEDFLAFNVSNVITVDSLIGSLARGIFNFRPETTWLEATGWLAYVALAFYLFVGRKPKKSTKVAVTLKTPVNA